MGNDQSLAETFKKSKKNMVERFEYRKKESKNLEENENLKNKTILKTEEDKKQKKIVDRKELIERLNRRQRKKESPVK